MKKKNSINKTLPAANTAVSQPLRAELSDDLTEIMWDSILRVGTYIKLLEREVEFFQGIGAPPLKQLVNDQLVNLKRYQIRISSMFAQDDDEVVRLLVDDMENNDSINDVVEVIDVVRKLKHSTLFVKVLKELRYLTDDKEKNKVVFDRMQAILEREVK